MGKDLPWRVHQVLPVILPAAAAEILQGPILSPESVHSRWLAFRGKPSDHRLQRCRSPAGGAGRLVQRQAPAVAGLPGLVNPASSSEYSGMDSAQTFASCDLSFNSCFPQRVGVALSFRPRVPCIHGPATAGRQPAASHVRGGRRRDRSCGLGGEKKRRREGPPPRGHERGGERESPTD